MTPDEILHQLQHLPNNDDFAPYRAALLAAVDQREAITPELIAAVDRITADPMTYRNRPDDYLHHFAICLLAQFREPRALDSFLRFFSLPGEQSLDLTGDMITKNGAAVLASVCGGDPAPLLRLARDEAVNEFVRTQAIDALLVQSVWGERPRNAVIDDLRQLFQTLPKPGNGYVWATLAGTVCDFDAPELLPEARQAFAEELVDESVIGLEDIDPDIPRQSRGFPRPSGPELFKELSERNAPIDAVAECAGWLCFRDDTEAGDYLILDHADLTYDPPILPPLDPDYAPPQPYIAPPKIGRNDPCPCSSGKKYKKCCG